MALIKCPECGNDISDQAPKCPKCGYVLNAETEKSTENADKKEKNKQQWKKYAPIIIALALVVVVFRFLNTQNENNQGGTGSQGQNPTSSDTSSYTSSGSVPAPSTKQGTYQGFVVYADTKLGVSYEIPSSYKVYTGTKNLTYVGTNIDSKGALIPYVMLNWDSNYNNPIQYLNAFTDELRKAYSDVKITIEPISAYIGQYLVYGIQYMYTSSGHTVVDNRYVTVINNQIFMITTKEENQNTDEINNVVTVMFKTLKVGS